MDIQGLQILLENPIRPEIQDTLATVASLIDSGDLDAARPLLTKAETITTTSDEFGAISSVILESLGDLDWGRSVLMKAVDAGENASKTAMLAMQAIVLDDEKLVHSILAKAAERVTGVQDAMAAVTVAEIATNDLEVREAFYRAGERMAGTVGDYIELANSVALNDADRAREYLAKAETMATTEEEREQITTAMDEIL